MSSSSAMDARHAAMGRRTLEEIRQKLAAERSHRASSGSESESANPYGGNRSDSGGRIGERDTFALQSRIKELEDRNAELDRENHKLVSQLKEKDIENEQLLRRVIDLEQNSLPSIRKTLKDVSLEKDAAIVAKEDALSQLRTIKKQLKEAEEDQYRAEETAAALRSELNSLQQQNMANPFGSMPSTSSKSEEQILAMEKEIMDLKSALQQESVLRQQNQQKLIEEQVQMSTLLAEKQDLEERLAALSKKSSEEASEAAARMTFSLEDKSKLEEQLHDMALMVERLESSRQKLLMEIDSQSSEIERLFEENANLMASYQDAQGVAGQWENQVKECLKQNEELRSTLEKLRSEKVISLQTSANKAQPYVGTELNVEDVSVPGEVLAENLLLKDQLAKEQTRAEALAAEIMKLSSELKHATQLYNNLTRLYRPVLRNIEINLMKMKQESYVTVQ